MNELARTVLILGLGDSGLAMARWCTGRGFAVRVWDSREAPPAAEALKTDCPDAHRLAGELTVAQLQGVDRVLKSPGLSPYDARIAPLLQAAQHQGLPVHGELDLFVQALAAIDGYAPKILAITGTNGKTTTTAMTALLVERAGKTVAVAGNIGPTMLDTLAACVNALPEVWVLELSSFQLDGGGTGVRGFEPAAAAVLNITQDHLDWHGSMAAYVAAKARVFGEHAVMVINRDDPAVLAMVPAVVPVKGKTRGVPRDGPREGPREVLHFGLGTPGRPGDFGLITEGGMAWLVRAVPSDETIKRKKGEDEEIHLQRLMPADALRVRGRHNAANALAALALATAIGCPLAPMLHGLREYSGEPHRVEWVGNVGEVEAFDDSKGTNVGATVAALVGLGADKAPGRLVVILGGDGKGQDFTPLAAPVQRYARAVATIGRDAAAIEATLEGAHVTAIAAGAGVVPLKRHTTLEAATAWCFEQAHPGDAVLLSPACASLDMFRNYAHRAEVFVAAVKSLGADRGQV